MQLNVLSLLTFTTVEGPCDRHLMMRLGQAAAAGQLAILCANKRKQVQEG